MLVYRVTPDNPIGEVVEMDDDVAIDNEIGNISISVGGDIVDVYVDEDVCSYEVHGMALLPVGYSCEYYTDHYFLCIVNVLEKYMDDILGLNVAVLTNIAEFIRLSYDKFVKLYEDFNEEIENFVLKAPKSSRSASRND